jgi:hypothetical protein
VLFAETLGYNTPMQKKTQCADALCLDYVQRKPGFNKHYFKQEYTLLPDSMQDSGMCFLGRE